MPLLANNFILSGYIWFVNRIPLSILYAAFIF